MEPTAQHLYDLGRRDLESRYDPELKLVRNPFLADKHMPHPSLWYAFCLLQEGRTAGIELAHEIIEHVLTMQEVREGDPHHGNFRWHLEDGAVIDLNAGQFVLEALIHLVPRVGDRLRSHLLERIFTAMRLVLAEAARLDVHWTYTNIHLLDIQNRILGGQILQDSGIRKSGEGRLAGWAERTRLTGAPHEFNSPTYAAVQIQALATVAGNAEDAATRALALEMEQRLWRHAAQFWHAPTMQLCGPHSRAYRRDVVGAPGFLKVLLYKLLADKRLLATTPYYEGPAAEGQVMVALTQHHCPSDAEQMFREPAMRLAAQPVCISPKIEANAVITPRFALGTMSRPYGVGEPPEPWPGHDACIAYFAQATPPGYGVLYTRYRVNAGPVGRVTRPAPDWLDIWDDGLFRCSQRGARAIVAYGLMPRGQRPVEGLRLDIRVLAPELNVFVAGKPATEVAAVPPSPVVIAAGDTWLGIVPLEPSLLGHHEPVMVWRDGQELVVSIINYEGPPKQFWEYRSLGGPFFKGNVRNGFCLAVGTSDDFADHEEFVAYLDAMPLKDEMNGSVRRITWGGESDRLTLEYDLRTMWP